MQETISAHTSLRHTQSAPRIAFRTLGEKGDWVVLLHGVGSSGETWNTLLDHLAPSFRYLIIDYRGHGASDGPQAPYSLNDFVHDHRRVIDEVGIEAAHIVGFSIGAIFAQAIAVEMPKRTLSLVLLNSIGGRTEAEQSRALERLQVIRSTPPAEIAEGSKKRWFTENFIAARPDLVAREYDIVSANRPAPYAATYEVLATTEILPTSGRVSQPTLIITGELDQGSTPLMSQKLHALIPGSKLEIRPGLKHYLHIEDAEAIAALVNSFLAENADNTVAPAKN